MREQLIFGIVIVVIVAALGVRELVRTVSQARALNSLRQLSMLLSTHLFETEPALAPYPLKQWERVLAVKVLAAEARGEGILGQVAVAQVMLDRLLHPDFGFKPSGAAADMKHIAGEFAFPYQGPIPASCWAAIEIVFDQGWRFTRDPLLYFMNPDKASARGREWIEQNALPKLRIGNHVFYTERKAN